MRKLAMDFQPVFMSGRSLRRTDKSHWEQKVRPRVVSAKHPKCCVCDFVAQERRLIHADEVWAFPGTPNVLLADIRPLCVFCHEAKDFAHTLILIAKREDRQSREAKIRSYYCKINECSEEEFKADFDQALAKKRAIEEKYGMNCSPVVDYGAWNRPPERPRLSDAEKDLLRGAFDILGEPFETSTHTFGTYGSAVRRLQAIPIAERALMLAEIKDRLEEEYDDDGPLAECEGFWN